MGLMQKNNQPQEIEKSWRHGFALWWAISWRIFLCWFVLMGVATYVQQAWLLLLPQMADAIIFSTLLFVPPLGVWACRSVLNKNFRGFRLALMPLPPKAEAEPDAAQQQKDEISHTHPQ